jgi:UDP-4-amino-4,6-dideoxy-N-acetyl-beta-L-altrosamine N-acetyltransferase
LLAWRNQPDVAQWMFTDHVITAQEHEQWLTSMLLDPKVKYWMIEVDDVPQGVVHLASISSVQRRCEWGMYLGEQAARGTGAAEAATFLSLDWAFRQLGMEQVICEVLATNDRALRLYERVGFRRDDYLRSHVTKGSTTHDVVVMSILQTAWEKLRPELHGRLQRQNLIAGAAAQD